MKIRPEMEKDYRKVEEVTREAFWNLYFPGCVEHFLIHELRKGKDFIKELSLVAEEKGKILGHIAYTKGIIKTEDGKDIPAVCFGPVSVLPQYQKKGIGRALIKISLAKAAELGHKIVCIMGDPRYYSQFGFRSAERFEIKTADGYYAAALMALELVPGELEKAAGRFVETPDFDVDTDKFQEFEKHFPEKEKAETPSQKDFQIISGLRYKTGER